MLRIPRWTYHKIITLPNQIYSQSQLFVPFPHSSKRIIRFEHRKSTALPSTKMYEYEASHYGRRAGECKEVAGPNFNHEDLAHSKDNISAVVFICKSANMFAKGTSKIFQGLDWDSRRSNCCCGCCCFCHTRQLARSQLLDQRLDLHSQQWKCWVLTSGPSGNSQRGFYFLLFPQSCCAITNIILL